ncbi:glutathione S-transferase U17-like [Spinacia oleracea]|uniref:Glutathione S-transferase n=1 Tax=Spinacia oleracea TaxID=3562 RepID=A0A9R0HRU6_SPIOL|nr:glutathione S-transferase U17-like [Spinacia oleracea]
MQWFPSLQGTTKAQTEEAKEATLEKTTQGLSLIEDAFVKCNQGKSFFGGDSIVYLDIAFGSYLGWLRVTEKTNNIELLNKEKMRNLLVWADKFCADDSVKDYMLDTAKLAEFSEIIFARFKAAAST